MASEHDKAIERLRTKRPEVFDAVYQEGRDAAFKALETAAAELRNETAAYIENVRQRILAAERVRGASLVALGSQHGATAGAIMDAIRDGIGPTEFLARLGVEAPNVDPSRVN